MNRSFLLGDAVRIKHGFAFPGTQFSEDESLPILLTPGNFALGGGFKHAKPKSFAGGDYPAEFMLEPGDLVVTMTDLSKAGDTLGLPAVIPDNGLSYLHNQRIGLVEVVEPTLLDKNFLQYYLRTSEYRSYILGTASGSTVRHTSPNRIAAFPADVPPVDIQRAIGEVLGALDDKIAANDRIQGVTDELCRAGFQRLTANHSKTELASIATVNAAVTKPEAGRTLRYIDISSVGQGTYAFPEESLWDEAPGRARRIVCAGDTIWSTVRPNRRSHALVLDDDSLLIASTGLAVLKPQDRRAAGLYEASRTEYFSAYLESVAEGSAYPAVRADRFERAPIPALHPEEWEAFESFALPLRQRAHATEVESRGLRAVRDALLPLLMSGKVRVRDAARRVADAL